MIQRKTQTADYWRAFTLTPDDAILLRDLLLDAQEPRSNQSLALALIGERVRREESEIRAELARGELYQPRKSYALGDRVIFPALDFRLGEVVGVRPGRNPEYGQFQVATIDFGPDRRQRSFAADLSAPHKLNTDPRGTLFTGESPSAQSLLDTIASEVPAKLAKELAVQGGFVAFEDFWLLSDQVAEIHIGHLNIGEALIEMRVAPIDTETLLAELELPAEISHATLVFSVQSALTADARFDQVGPRDTRQWFLRRLEPPEALEIPAALRYQPVGYNRDALTVELLQLEWELDDEWAEESSAVQMARQSGQAVPVLLTYPHLSSGTLPLGSRGRTFFSHGHGERTMLTFIDGRWGQRFPGWVVRSGRYVAGLRPWFDQHKLPAGTIIVLDRSNHPDEVRIDFRPKRMRREWMRMAQVVDGTRLDFQLRKQAVSCEYDEQVIIGVDDPEQIARLSLEAQSTRSDLSSLVYQVFGDLAGLSLQGSVHPKTLYSAVNVLRRSPPGPIFAVLASDPRFQQAGDGFYRLAVDA